jgi:vacuolar-type H+-ATPase subunit I/STV1
MTSFTTAIFASLPLLLMHTSATAQELYRYTNASGNTVIDYQVPAEYMDGGYEVLNTDGVVLRVIPRELTDEERAAWTDQERRDAQVEAERERLRKWDESLLLRYSSVADIEDAQSRALRDLRIRLNILKGNKRSLKHQVENYQVQAADLERAGTRVSPELLSAIEALQDQIELADRAIADRNREISEVSESYQFDIERFEQLQEIVELRRNLSQSQSTN